MDIKKMDFKETAYFAWVMLKVLGLTLFYYAEALYRFFVPAEKKNLDEEIILITGAGSGIGKAICEQLSETKATLVLWDINEKETDKIATYLKKQGNNAYSYKVDVTNKEQVTEAAKRVLKDVGHVTMLFNNAGIAKCSPMLDTDDGALEQTIQVNLISHFWTLKAFLPKMLERRNGHIVTTCSMAGFYPIPFGVAYGASKFGVRGMIEALRHELNLTHKDHNVKFSTIFPTFVDTPLVKNHSFFTIFGDYLETKLNVNQVAERIVDGVRRNEDNISIPKFIPEISMINYLPTKLAFSLERALFTEVVSPKKSFKIR